MKKTLLILLAAMLMLALAACGDDGTVTPSASPQESITATTPDASDSGDSQTGEMIKVTIGATPAPHAKILEFIKPLLAERGIELIITEFNDYVIPNTSVQDGSLDANYFQHVPFMENFNAENNGTLVSLAEVHYEPMGLYPGKTDAIDALAEGATIAIPNDSTNGGRALLLLQQAGLIELTDPSKLDSTIVDIAKNEKDLDIIEMEAAQIPLSLSDIDMGVINGNYALSAGLAMDTALAVEDQDAAATKAYVNILAVKEENKDNEALKTVAEVLLSQQVADYMLQEFENAVVPYK